jgi:hypothetical protein
MNRLTMMALAACAAALTGCQTRITIESDETKPLPVQQLVEVDGTNRVITTGYFEGRPHYCITARSPLYAKESVARFAAGVGEKGTWTINADGYSRDLSTNAVVMVREMFAGGAQLAIAIGDAYTKIAGGGAQADTALSVAQKVYSFFTSKGGDASKATVTTDAGKLKVSDGTTCVECAAAGNCSECTYAGD